MTDDENRRIEVFERELWRIAVEHLDYGEQVQWAALAGARVAPAGWRRARAMLHFDEGGELKRTFLLTAVERNKNPQLRLRALQEISASRDAEAFDRAIEMIGGWPREEKREGVKVVLQSLAEKKIGRRDQANNWIWACAEMTREVHEEYAVQRWPETKRLLGLLVNSSGGAHARNARRLVHTARQQDRRLAAALLAAALPHTAEAGEVINGARTRMSRKPAALARELLRNFPKGGKGRRGQRRRKKGKAGEAGQLEATEIGAATFDEGAEETAADEQPRRRRSRASGSGRGRSRAVKHADPDDAPEPEPEIVEETAGGEGNGAVEEKPKRARFRAAAKPVDETAEPKLTRIRSCAAKPADENGAVEPKPKRATRSRTAKKDEDPAQSIAEAAAAGPRRRAKPKTGGDANGAAPPLERASERVRDAVREAKPAGDEVA